MNFTHDQIKKAIINSLLDVNTGPLSDTPYVRGEISEDGTALYLFDTEDESDWPIASIDVDQLAADILYEIHND